MATGDDDINQTEQLVQKLYSGGKLSVKLLSGGSTSYRIQGSGHKNAEYYGCPKKPEELGRFNDPREEIGIWYGAEHPSGALAETFGRLRPKESKGLGIVINATDLETRDMCVVKTTRDLKLLNLKLCLSKMNRTVDEVTGPDYTLTQESGFPGSDLNLPEQSVCFRGHG